MYSKGSLCTVLSSRQTCLKLRWEKTKVKDQHRIDRWQWWTKAAACRVQWSKVQGWDGRQTYQKSGWKENVALPYSHHEYWPSNDVLHVCISLARRWWVPQIMRWILLTGINIWRVCARSSLLTIVLLFCLFQLQFQMFYILLQSFNFLLIL